MAFLVSARPRCIVYEDEHLLVVNKPAGLNTHSPSPYAGEGIYEWLKCREPRRADLGIIHRLDKVTSGLMVFAKTRLANRSLTEQFTNRTVRKNYVFLTTGRREKKKFTVESTLSRAGERYAVRPARPGAEIANTTFEYAGRDEHFERWHAHPLTGRTHQIRAHAQSNGIPILGDDLYGGAPFGRVCLHARELAFLHPETQEKLSFSSEPNFFDDPAIQLRELLIESELTNAYRIIHGPSDGLEKFYVEKWAEYLLSQSESTVTDSQEKAVRQLSGQLKPAGVYHKALNRQVRKAAVEESTPRLVVGKEAPEFFQIKENGIKYAISFRQGYSVGLFLDQRENRRRLSRNYVAPGFNIFGAGPAEVLNTFAYTCGFSVCAALAGARTISLDLSKKYLDWGRRNFELNGLNPDQHDFIYGDVFDWASRLERKGRRFDLILLDPPTFSQARKGKPFQAEKNYGELIRLALPLLKRGGVLFASTNAQRLSPEEFLGTVQGAIVAARRNITARHYVPQPFDFPISKEEPAYLKTAWFRIE